MITPESAREQLLKDALRALWAMQESPDCWGYCEPDDTGAIRHSEACAMARAVTEQAKALGLTT